MSFEEICASVLNMVVFSIWLCSQYGIGSNRSQYGPSPVGVLPACVGVIPTDGGGTLTSVCVTTAGVGVDFNAFSDAPN